MMQPSLKIISSETINQILGEAFQLMMSPGIKVQLPEARNLLADAGARVDEGKETVHIPERVIEETLKTVPKQFYLFDRLGEPVIHFGGDIVHFDPGSSGVNVLDPDTYDHRPATRFDLIQIIKIADSLPQLDAQSTALVCNEIPKSIGDLYRLYLVLLYSMKPVVTGSFTVETTGVMIDMLSIFAGSAQALIDKPTAIFDVCPSPPLIWSHFGAQSLIDLARRRVPAEIVSMPLAGAAAPVTLLGSVVQHAAESLSGIAIHQLAQPGSPIVWGGAPAIMDMRFGTTPMGAIETAMIDCAYAQVGKALGIPTHAYLGASDAKIPDAQAGLESGITTILGALAGINMISGAGMLDFLACISPEKLVIDAEAIGMSKRLLAGMKVLTPTLATEMFNDFSFKGEFLKQKITRQLVRTEQYIPSGVIDRGTKRTWQHSDQLDCLDRAKLRVSEIISAYNAPILDPHKVSALKDLVTHLAIKAGMESLPALES
jgi:trimethylamine--corrinoid protein Co-methyltransferase